MLNNKRVADAFLLLVFALTTAALYSCLLPLWEGFDEPFHYGYIQSLSIAHRFPVLGQTRVSSEIRESLKLTPVSPILHRSLPNSVSFPEWFQLSPGQRAAKKRALSALAPDLQQKPTDLINYEAQQAPLAYIVLLPLHALVARMPIPQRILVLRLFVACLSTLLLLAAALPLSTALGLTHAFAPLALLCIVESQMLWASIAHVDNDWLAIPLAIGLLASLTAAVREMRARNVLLLGALLGFGLLTKAYFLAFIPVFLALLIYRKLRSALSVRTFLGGILLPLAIAGPWYIRNVFLYGSMSGMQEATRGVTLHDTLEAVLKIDWLRSTMSLAHWSLWTANWSFVSFSRATLDAELLLLLCGFLLLFLRVKRITTAELWLCAALASFAAALVYDACVTWADTHGVSSNALPWYPQAVMPAIWLIAFLGFERNGLIGRVLAVISSLVAAWIALLTYVAKLLPLYGGYGDRATLGRLWHWWTSNPTSMLSTVTLAAPPLVYGLLAAFLLQLAFLNVHLLRRLARPSQ